MLIFDEQKVTTVDFNRYDNVVVVSDKFFYFWEIEDVVRKLDDSAIVVSPTFGTTSGEPDAGRRRYIGHVIMFPISIT